MMRIFANSMKYFIAAVSALTALTSAAQSDGGELFAPSQEQMNEAAEAVAKTYGKTEEKKAPYVSVIGKAFKAYMAIDSVTSVYTSATLPQLTDSIKKLEKIYRTTENELKEKQKELKKLRKADDDKRSKADKIAQARIDSIDKAIAAKNLELAQALRADSTLRADIDSIRKEVMAINDATNNLSDTLTELRAEHSRGTAVKGEIDKRKASAENVVSEIRTLCDRMARSNIETLTDADLKESKRILASNKALLENYRPDLIPEAEAIIEQEEMMLSGTALVKRAITAMEGKYDPTVNMKLAGEISRFCRENKISDPQYTEMDNIRKELGMQGKNVESMTEMLRSFYADGFTPSSDADFKELKRKINSVGINSRHFKTLQAVRDGFIDRLDKEAKTGSPFGYDEKKFKGFIDSLTDKL